MEGAVDAEKLLSEAKKDDFDVDCVVPEKERNGASQNLHMDAEEGLHSVSVSWDSEKESSKMEIKKEDEPKVGKVEVDVHMNSVENAELEKKPRKRRKVDTGDTEGKCKKVAKKLKEEITDDIARGGGRILRSRVIVSSDGGNVADKPENSSTMVQQNCKGRFSKKIIKQDRESNNQLSTGSQKLKKKRGRPPKVEKEADEVVSSPRKKLKRKRGRPRKSESENSLLFDIGPKKKLKVKKKRGRPRKVEKKDDNPLVGGLKRFERKLGRPPKLQQSNGALKDEHTEGRKASWARDLNLKLRNRVKCNVPTDSLPSDKRQTRRKLNQKRTLLAGSDRSQDDLETEATLVTNSKVIACSDKIKEVKKVKKVGEPKITEVECSRSAAKNLLREKITDILLTAGWTIEFRPRFNRQYKDAVYVSPEGRTHWSITLAYNVLKKHYDEGNGDHKVYKAGFVFTPIPEEEIMTLTRNTTPGIKKGKKHRGNGKVEKKGFNGKAKCKEKGRSTWSSVSKSIKKKMKGNTLLHEPGISDHKLEEGFPSSLRKPGQRKTQDRKRCALLVRNTKASTDSNTDGYLPYNGKRTLLAWMIDLGVLSLDEKVQYMNQKRTQVELEGRITRDGIHCDCCAEVITISKFEMHAESKLDQPFENICVQTGTSLLQCLLEACNKQTKPQNRGYHFVDVDVEDPNDDTCGICGDGGDLICCDSCPSTFHQSCLDIKKTPSGNWHCLYCSCKLCGLVTAGLHTMDDGHNPDASVLYACRLCEEKYHPECAQANDASDADVDISLFCGKKCQMLHEKLQMLVGVKQDMEEGFSWTLIHRSDIGSDINLCSEVAQKIKCNSKLAVALFVMDECFLPIIDHRSGINLIHNILHNCGSNFRRVNYSGFYTAILEKDDEIISAASLRIHGNELAEMPFIGTRFMYRRQGMCRRLLSAIESALSSLNVEKLVIPAISELRDTWMSVFGFKSLEETSKNRMRNMNLLVFPGVEMLQKPLIKSHLPMESSLPAGGLKSSQLVEHQTLEAVASSCEERHSPVCHFCSNGTARDGHEISDIAVNESSSEPNNKVFNNASELDNGMNSGTASFKVVNDNLEDRNKNFENSLPSSCCTDVESKETGQNQNAPPVSTISDADRTVELKTQLNQDSNPGLESCPNETVVQDDSPHFLSNNDTKSVACQVTAEDSVPNGKLESPGDGNLTKLDTISSDHPEETAVVYDRKKVCFISEIANGCHASSQMDGRIGASSQGDRLSAPVVSATVCSNCDLPDVA